MSVACRSVPAAEFTRPPGNEPARECFEKFLFPLGGVLLDGRQRARHAPAHVVRGALVALRVLFQQHVDADLLLRQGKF